MLLLGTTYFQIKLILVTIPCILGIVFAFVSSIGVYKVIIRIEYFDFLQILLIYVILGIGADDVFVVFDCWHQSEVHSSDDFERFRYTIRRSSQVCILRSTNLRSIERFALF